jgi:hypothetical protein
MLQTSDMLWANHLTTCLLGDVCFSVWVFQKKKSCALYLSSNSILELNLRILYACGFFHFLLSFWQTLIRGMFTS